MQLDQYHRTLLETADTAEIASTCELCGYTIQYGAITGDTRLALAQREQEHAQACQASSNVQ